MSWRDEIVFRARRGDALCLGTHEVHHADGQVWTTCSGVPFGARLTLDASSQDWSDVIRHHVMRNVHDHERAVAARVVLKLAGES